MSTSWRFGLLGLVGVLALGCSGDGTGPNGANVVGTWQATQVVVIKVANPAVTQELVSQGLQLTIVFRSDQTFTATTTLPGNPPEVSSGTYATTASSLTITTTSSSPPETLSFTLSLSGNTLTLTGGSTTFDFSGTGDEPATINLTLSRQ